MFEKKVKVACKDSRKNKWNSSKQSQQLKSVVHRLEQITASQHEHNGPKLTAEDYLLISLKRKTKVEKMVKLVDHKQDYKKANTNHYGRKGINLGDFYRPDRRTKSVTAR